MRDERTTITLHVLAIALMLALLAVPAAVAQSSGGHVEHDGHGEHEGDAHAHHRAMLRGGVQVEDVRGLDIPDVEVLTQDGETVHFYRDLVAGKTVAMNFIFTTCRTICPPLGANFGKLQDLLGERAGDDVHLISVSVDPVTDTPERLRAWGETFGAGPAWTLVTGDKTQVTKLLKALQVFTADINDHSPVVLMGDADSGSWTRAYGLAPPPDLVEMIDSLPPEDPSAAADHHDHDHGEGPR